MQRQRGEGTAMISKRLVIIVSVLFAAIAVTGSGIYAVSGTKPGTGRKSDGYNK